MNEPGRKFTYESMEDRETLVAHLRAVTEGLAKGTLVLASNGEEVVLSPRGLLRLRIKANRGGSRSRLTIKLAWREDRGDDVNSGPLEIRTGNT